ncbi:MAG: hypothetical protein H0W76_03065 [Pyrinomonadaceae bacterium]|nr:hypothetical protein [Pyrinomonadaceae bacterium]
MNPQGVVRGAGAAASVDLINKVGQYALIWRNTREIPKLDAEIQQLERQLTANNYYRVPPRPENLPKLEAELTRVFVPKDDPQPEDRDRSACNSSTEIYHYAVKRGSYHNVLSFRTGEVFYAKTAPRGVLCRLLRLLFISANARTQPC